MPALNDEVNALDNKVPGALQLSLYADVQNLLLDRIVWFLRNVDFAQGLKAIVTHYRDGIAQVATALDGAMSKESAATVAAREAELTKAGVPAGLAKRMTQLPMLAHAPDIVLIASGARSVIADVTKTYFAAEAFFRLDRIAGAVKDIAVGDYFDRLALDRALDTIGDAERRITTAMVGNGAAGAAAVEKWATERGADVERVKAAIQEIAASGLTISKLTVAASMLGDLARR
jgi:glutamate dehydrogenase